MSDRNDEKIEDIGKKVTQMHTFIFGHDGQGGLSRDVEALKEEVQILRGFRAKMAGVGAGIGIIGGILGGKISKFFSQ